MRFNNLIPGASVLALAMLIILLCGSFFFPRATSAKAQNTSQALMQALSKPREAPTLILPALDGGIIDLQRYQSKYVLLNFWADWCAPCLKEMPFLQEVSEQLDENKWAVLAVHAGPRSARFAELIKPFNISFPILLDEQLQLGGWRVNALPLTYLIDPAGLIIFRASGMKHWTVDGLRALVEAPPAR